MQPDNEIWAVNRIQQEKYFSLEIMQKMWQKDWFQTSFCFFFKALYEVKETACSLVSVVHFDSPQLAIQSKQTV